MNRAVQDIVYRTEFVCRHSTTLAGQSWQYMIQTILGQLDRGIGRRSESVRGIPQSSRVVGSGIPVRHPSRRADA